VKPIVAIYEQLLAIKQSAYIGGLSNGDLDQICWRNAHGTLAVAGAISDSGVKEETVTS
jgi:hypothetical protein